MDGYKLQQLPATYLKDIANMLIQPISNQQTKCAWIIQVAQQDPSHVLLHATEAGDPYYIGDVYENEPYALAQEWQIDDSKYPYLQHIKKLSNKWRHLRFLADFMEVGTTPLRWKYLYGTRQAEQERRDRADQTNVMRLDFLSDGTITKIPLKTGQALQDNLDDIAKGSGQSDKPGNEQRLTEQDATAGAQREVVVNGNEAVPVQPIEQPPMAKPPSHEPNQKQIPIVRFRLFVSEDLSRRVIESLGSTYDIDPSFFREHIVDYAWYNVRDRFMDPPKLDIIMQQQDWFQLRWVRARYFQSKESYDKARVESNRFNVLRRPDDDLNNGAMLDDKKALIGLTRTRASFWMSQPNKDVPGGVPTGILLVDPTNREGIPIWRGYRNWESPQSMHDQSSPSPGPPNDSLFEDIIYWTSKAYVPSPCPLEDLSKPIVPIQAFLHLVCAEWLQMISYLTTRLGQLEWEVALPEDFQKGEADDSTLKKLHVWRRLVPLYIEMLQETLKHVFRFPFPPSSSPIDPNACNCNCACSHRKVKPPFHVLQPSFAQALTKMEELQNRLGRLTMIATAAINIAESRMQYKENKNISRLSWLATIFIPLTFITGLLSIQPNIPQLQETGSFKYFFAIAIPLAIITILGSTPLLQPPHRNNIPLCLALLLKKQRRANISPPPWLNPTSLTAIHDFETEHSAQFSPGPRLPPGSSTVSAPFLPSSTAEAPPDALPYHWEVRMAKLRDGVDVLEAGGGEQMNGVGGMEVAEGRAFIGGVVDGLRKVNAPKEQARQERENDERENGYPGIADDDDEDILRTRRRDQYERMVFMSQTALCKL
ncbi:hypothetical protein BT63DRAFT_480711 [Microthyrium microscopicum]|uniref:Uncharacterized protein n=1 Tax=Microthyrium microscopicum TaxID=703497 RepID=A0A6A6U8M7_9PEZI|nr:hypothetical protein BT63DRAFT_480711 [Microthyrium microscopicum]